jgi:hypothetical protein
MFTLSPIKSKRYTKYNPPVEYVENVAVIAAGYPWAICHIDTFGGVEFRDIYTRLKNGEVVNVSLTIVKEEPSEQDLKEIERVNRAIMAGMPSAPMGNG